MNVAKLKRLWLVILGVQLLFLTWVSVDSSLRLARRGPWFTRPSEIAHSLAMSLGMMAFMYGLVLAYDLWRGATARRSGESPATVAMDALINRVIMAGFMGLQPCFAITDVGWLRSLPLFALFFLYLLGIYLRWKRYRRSLALA